jgi:5'-nucleotidase
MMFGTIKLTTMTLACHLLLSKEEIHVNAFTSTSTSQINIPLAFTSMTHRIPTTNNNNHNNINQITAMRMSSSYEFDSDEASEQLIADKRSAYVQESQESTSTSTSTSTIPNNNLNGKITTPTKFDHVLEEVGLKGQLSSLHDLSPKRQVSRNGVFCNRELQLSGVRAIGFDMDYTIAQYKQPAFDKLAFDGAKEKLVHNFGYPKELLDVEYDHTFWVRGLIIDTQRGNFLKIDRHKYVRVAYHGFEPISSRTRKDLYSRFFNQVPSFSEKQYINMDTLFQFVDASLFATLIEMKDQGEHDVLDFKTYDEIYKDIRECVDLCHRDGVIKDEVARNPEKYIVLDDGMIPMLKKFRDDGIKVFLLTNSYWEYTSDAMNYLFHQKDVDKETKLKNEWVDLFDLVVVGSCKPAYLIDPYLNLFRVNPRDGSLLNTDGIFEIDALGENGAQKFLDQGRIFQGGNWKHLTAMLEIEAGEEIMYVGDHLYSDVLRSKRTLGWRSVFIMPELPEEMETFYKQRPLQLQINKLRKLRDELSVHSDMIHQTSDVNDPEVQMKLAKVQEDDDKVKAVLRDLAQKYHTAFHPIWGMMFSAGYQDSRLAYFVTNYACLYTAKATNLGLASTTRSFRTSGEALPHDKLLVDEWSEFIDIGE